MFTSKEVHSIEYGFSDGYEQEKTIKLQVEGLIPTRLCGNLYRNGPGQFSVGKTLFNHWFDGYGLVHNFSFDKGNVTYTSKFVQTEDYKKSNKEEKVTKNNFAININESIFSKLLKVFKPNISDNASVNIFKVHNKILAAGETTGIYRLDKETLETLEQYSVLPDGFQEIAHPLRDINTGEYINLAIKLGMQTEYKLFSLDPESQVVQTIWKTTKKHHTYIHSFGLSKKYIVLIETPLTANLNKVLFGTYLDGLERKENSNSIFRIIDRKTGKEKVIPYFPFFFFHIANTFEKDNKVIIDVSTYINADHMKYDFLIKEITKKSKFILDGNFRRFSIDLASLEITEEVLFDNVLEFPLIHYRRSRSNHTYQFIYGCSSHKNFIDTITKVAIQNSSQTIRRYQEDCYPGEAVFVESPGSVDEDDGVLLSVIFDAKNTQSFLLILNAKDLKEIGRCYLPNVIPFGFHGNYYSK